MGWEESRVNPGEAVADVEFPGRPRIAGSDGYRGMADLSRTLKMTPVECARGHIFVNAENQPLTQRLA